MRRWRSEAYAHCFRSFPRLEQHPQENGPAIFALPSADVFAREGRGVPPTRYAHRAGRTHGTAETHSAQRPQGLAPADRNRLRGLGPQMAEIRFPSRIGFIWARPGRVRLMPSGGRARLTAWRCSVSISMSSVARTSPAGASPTSRAMPIFCSHSLTKRRQRIRRGGSRPKHSASR